MNFISQRLQHLYLTRNVYTGVVVDYWDFNCLIWLNITHVRYYKNISFVYEVLFQQLHLVTQLVNVSRPCLDNESFYLESISSHFSLYVSCNNTWYGLIMRAKVFEKRKFVESWLQEIPSKQVRPLLSIYFFMHNEPVPWP